MANNALLASLLGGGKAHDPRPIGGDRSRELSQLLLSQSLGGQVRNPIEGIGKLAQAWASRSLADKAMEQDKARNEQLASALAPESWQDVGGGTTTAVAGIPGFSVQEPNIQDINADKRQQIAALLNGGAIASSDLKTPLLANLGIGTAKEFDTTPRTGINPETGKRGQFILDKLGNTKWLDAAPETEMKLNNGVAYDPFNLKPGDVVDRNDPNKPFNPVTGAANTPYQQYEMGKTVAGRPSTNIALNTEKTFAGNVASGLAGQFTANREKAQAAASGIQALQEAKHLLNSGIFTGQLGELQLLGAKMGIGDTSKISSTEAFQAAMGRQTLALVKNLGAGAGISNADREYAEKVAGGKITLNKESLEKIIDINERAQRNVIRAYNQEAAQVARSPAMQGFPTDITVPEPSVPTRFRAIPEPNGIPTVETPEEARKLPRGTRFRTPDGQERVVP